MRDGFLRLLRPLRMDGRTGPHLADATNDSCSGAWCFAHWDDCDEIWLASPLVAIRGRVSFGAGPRRVRSRARSSSPAAEPRIQHGHRVAVAIDLSGGLCRCT